MKILNRQILYTEKFVMKLHTIIEYQLFFHEKFKIGPPEMKKSEESSLIGPP
jgi:hypothetical protein